MNCSNLTDSKMTNNERNVFLCCAPLFFYVNLLSRFGQHYRFGFYSEYWISNAIPFTVVLIYLALLMHFSLDIGKRINPAYMRLEPIIYSLIMVVLTFANAFLFGIRNKGLMLNLGVIAVICIALTMRGVFSGTTDTSSR